MRDNCFDTRRSDQECCADLAPDYDEILDAQSEQRAWRRNIACHRYAFMHSGRRQHDCAAINEQQFARAPERDKNHNSGGNSDRDIHRQHLNCDKHQNCVHLRESRRHIKEREANYHSVSEKLVEPTTSIRLAMKKYGNIFFDQVRFSVAELRLELNARCFPKLSHITPR